MSAAKHLIHGVEHGMNDEPIMNACMNQNVYTCREWLMSSESMQVYAASRGQEQLRVYNLRYKDSFEQDKYAASLRREQSILEELIRAKGHMVLPDLQQARPIISEKPWLAFELRVVIHCASNAGTCTCPSLGAAES